MSLKKLAPVLAIVLAAAPLLATPVLAKSTMSKMMAMDSKSMSKADMMKMFKGKMNMSVMMNPKSKVFHSMKSAYAKNGKGGVRMTASQAIRMGGRPNMDTF